MQIQRTHQTTSADDLLEMIPEATFVGNSVITPHPTLVGTYSYNADALKDLPQFDWGQLLSDDFLTKKTKTGSR